MDIISQPPTNGFHAVVLLRDRVEATEARVLLPGNEYYTFPGPRGSELDIAIANDLGNAARARAEKELQQEVREVVLVYKENPTITQDLEYGEEYDLKPSLQRKVLDTRAKLGVGDLEHVEQYYVLLTMRAVPMQFAAAAAPAPPIRDKKRTRALVEHSAGLITSDELDVRIEQKVKKLLAKAENPIGSVMVPSDDLMTIAKARGASASTELTEVGIKPERATQTVQLMLSRQDYLAARAKRVTAQEAPYYLGFCSLKSEKFLVQPLLTQLLEKVVTPFQYTAFDIHNKQTHLFDGGMPDNLLVRNESKERLADGAIPDLVDAANGLPWAVQQGEEQGPDDPSTANEVDELTTADLEQHGITPDRIGVIVEGKSKDTVDDPDSHLQLLKYMRDFLLAHPLRQHITGMLTDLQVANFYMLRRNHGGPRPPNDNDPSVPQMHHVQFLGKHTGADILQVLRSMLSGDGDILDDTPFFVRHDGDAQLSPVQFVQRLGRGGFGRVLHVKINHEDFAMKIPFRHDRVQPAQEYNVLQELEVTRKVADKCKNVPLWVARVEAVGKNYDSLLLMTPVGVLHSRHEWTKLLFLDLLDGYCTLRRRLLESGSAIVHRDIRPSNIVLARDERHGERLVLIDWGCAVDEGVVTTYAGSRAYAAQRLYHLQAMDLEVATRYHASCVDDYGSFLLTAASTFFMRDGMAECYHGFRSKHTNIYNMRGHDWLRFWHDKLSAAWWEQYTSLAAETDADRAYQTVRDFLDRHLPWITLGF